MTDDVTRLDSCEAAGISEANYYNVYCNFEKFVRGRKYGTREAMPSTYLRRATPDMYDELVRKYDRARIADDPVLLDDYPDERVVAQYLEKNELWVLCDRANGSVVGGCVITHEPSLRMDEDMELRVGMGKSHTPGENWYFPAKQSVTVKYPFVTPPYDPMKDIGALMEYAVRAAGSVGVYEVRAVINLCNKALRMLVQYAGFLPVCVVRRPTNERYAGYFTRRAPKGYNSWVVNEYRSPAFEKLTDDEYRRMLDEMGIDREENENLWQRS